jgi:hypothetical protein
MVSAGFPQSLLVFHRVFGWESFRTIDLVTSGFETERTMARYCEFLGRRVEVHYRAGDILLPASGTLVADSGRSIFLEQHLMQRGQQRHFRWEIPYQYIVRIEDKPEPPAAADGPNGATVPSAQQETLRSRTSITEDRASGTAAKASGAPAILPLPSRPKTA